MKTCFKCGRTKPLDDFYRHKAMRDGRLNKCKECTKADTKRNRDERIDYYREYDRKRGNRQPQAYRDIYRMTKPKASRARRILAYHVRVGNLTRKPCEMCGAKEGIHAHHDDYDRPLDVRWLCPVHHFDWHKENGEGANA